MGRATHDESADRADVAGRLRRPPREAWADNLKIVLVAGVIVAHSTMAWTGVGNWVLREPRLREPLLTLMTVPMVIGSLFGMALFFLLAGLFTPTSFARKGARRFVADRTVRLGVPMAFFVVALSPFVEYADSDNAGYDGTFWAFTVDTWWPPAPGPTWFLGVLLVFSVGYAITRTIWPASERSAPPRLRQLVGVGCAVVVASYLLRLAVPLGEEQFRLALSQAPGWIAGFCLGAVCAERGWLSPIAEQGRPIRLTAWLAAAGLVGVVGISSAVGADIDTFSGGPTWQALLVACFEAVLVVAMSLWVVDLFRRRFGRQGRRWRAWGRAAFAAFVVHQPVLVGLILIGRRVPWPPEFAYPIVSAAAVAASFGLGLLAVRLPGVRRVL